MNLLNFKQTTSYFTKKRPIVFLLFLFSLVCLIVSVQSGSVFIHSFLSAYVPEISWFWCYLVAVAIDCILFYLCAQLFSDVFCGVDGQRRYLDAPTVLLFLCFLSLSLFMSIKGADVRKSHHATELASDTTTKDAVTKMVASIDTTQTTISKNISRDQRKALEAKAEQNAKNVDAQKNILSALEIHKAQTEAAKKDFGELLDFSKSVVVIFQLLLIVCCACSEYIKSKSKNYKSSGDSKSESSDSGVIVPLSEPKNESDSKSESNSRQIGFHKNEGDIIERGGKRFILYAKSKGGFAEYQERNLKSQIGYYKGKGKTEQVERLQKLLDKLQNA